jgi:hypothetical protein
LTMIYRMDICKSGSNLYGKSILCDNGVTQRHTNFAILDKPIYFLEIHSF